MKRFVVSHNRWHKEIMLYEPRQTIIIIFHYQSNYWRYEYYQQNCMQVTDKSILNVIVTKCFSATVSLRAFRNKVMNCVFLIEIRETIVNARYFDYFKYRISDTAFYETDLRGGGKLLSGESESMSCQYNTSVNLFRY